MLRSRTGYGRAEEMVNGKVFIVEIRSLNGKQFEMLLKLPPLLKPYEFEIRSLLSEELVRGSIECTITLKQNGAVKPVTINTELARAYYMPLKELSDTLQIDTGDILGALLKLPEVITPSTDVFETSEWAGFRTVLLKAISDLNSHRVEEGAALESDLRQRIGQIVRLQTEVITLEPLRRERIRENLNKLLLEHVGREQMDPGRLEQELVFYIDKMDITEEQVRLTNHCTYFLDLLDGDTISKGKKLSFVLQEIGREINTTGAKAYDAAIQKHVVDMKDELEKAKEQILNVL